MKKITLKQNIINYGDEKKIANIIFSSKFPYANITDKTINKVISINKNISLNLLISLKNALLRNNMIMNYSQLLNKASIINSEYLNTNILKLSKKYNSSPINIMRIVLKYRGLNKSEILNLFFNNELMNIYDKQQFKQAFKYDVYALIDEKKQLTDSLHFEKKIEKILIKNNIRYKTQDILTVEQQKEGNVYCTPDFLILDELYINEKRVNWIDGKNFYGAYTNFIINKIKKQTKKYLKEYGSGCIIFNYGFSSKLHFKDIVLLNL